MNPSDLELSLKKQRLLMRCSALRYRTAIHANAIAPAFGGIDRVRAGVVWLRQHPEVLVATAVAVVVAKPRAAFSWARRGFFVWRTMQRLRSWLVAERV